MIRQINPTALDRKHLALRSIETAPMKHDLSGMIVNKPWGYEYLLTRTPLVEIWHLSLDYHKSTSTHCHPNKKTALIVLEGKALFSSLNKSWELSARDGVIIDARTFHSTQCISETGLKLIEIETPPMKHDLIRLTDKYGRANTGYEGKNKMKAFTKSYPKFTSKDANTIKNFCNNDICISVADSKSNLADDPFRNSELAVVLSGFIKQDTKVIYSTGDLMQTSKLRESKYNFNNVTFLSIAPNVSN